MKTRTPVRTFLAMLLVMAKKGVWVLEQPATSIAFRLRGFQDLLRKTTVPWKKKYISYICNRYQDWKLETYCFTLTPPEPIEVYKQSFWMRGFGAKTPKRTTLWSNSSGVRFFCTSKLARKGAKGDKAPKLADTYLDSQGRKKFKGNAQLRKSQF